MSTELKKRDFIDILRDATYYIEVVYETRTREISDHDPDDEWDRPDTETDWTIDGFKVSTDEKVYSDVETCFEPAFDEDYYLLYVIYTTGDSFGRDYRGRIEIIGLYREDELHIAEENRARIEAAAMDEETLTLLSQYDKEFDMWPPWTGYFEHLDYVSIDRLRRLK